MLAFLLYCYVLGKEMLVESVGGKWEKESPKIEEKVEDKLG